MTSVTIFGELGFSMASIPPAVVKGLPSVAMSVASLSKHWQSDFICVSAINGSSP